MDEDIVKKAKSIGLNLSKVSENALKDMISRIEGSNFSNSPKENTKLVRGVGFAP